MGLLTDLLGDGNATSTVLSGLLADRPAASADNSGDLYFATDVNGGTLYRSNGSSWVQAARGVNEPFADLHVVKSADETVNNSTVLQDDDHLFVTVEANATYWLDALIFYSTNATADLALKWAAPTGAFINWTSGGMHATGGTAGNYGDMSSALRRITDQAVLGGSLESVARPSGLLTVAATAGTFKLQWAQGTADASNSKVLAQSALRLHRLS